MKIRQRPSKKARIEIIPMIDVIFFLLVFFMVSSLAMTRINSLPVALPKTTSSPNALKQNVILTIRKNGSLFVNKAPTDLSKLGSQLAYEMRNSPQDIVIINADQGVLYGSVVQVMDRARQIGVRKFALATDPDGPPSSGTP
jgi:biopolymer transport protein ExbD